MSHKQNDIFNEQMEEIKMGYPFNDEKAGLEPVKKSKPAHTPTPWKLQNTRPDHPKTDPENRCQIVTVDPSIPGQHVATMSYFNSDESKVRAYQNAAFIVQAVNAHEDLVEACKLVAGILRDKQEMDEQDQYIVLKLEQALAKAGVKI